MRKGTIIMPNEIKISLKTISIHNYFRTFAKGLYKLKFMVVMYLTFGDRFDIHIQAYFSMLSFYRQLSDDDRIVMVTTNPNFYKRISFADIIPVNDKTIEEWKGKHHFLWRTKIKAIEMVAFKYSDSDLVYVDCDTFLYGDLSKLKEGLQKGQGYMDVDDGHPKYRKFKPMHMWEKIAGHTYAGITLGMQHHMWVAGVLGIPYSYKHVVIQTALQLCDEIMDDEPEDIVVEQYALSIAMYEKASLASTQDFIGHYWANKDAWIKMINVFMIRSYMTNATLEQDLKEFQQLPLSEVPTYLRKRNTARRLKTLIDKLFKPRDYTFIEKDKIIK